jgi:lipid-binding SYLF domain-containing protein
MVHPLRAALLLAISLLLFSTPGSAGLFATASEKRADIDALAEETLNRLFRESTKAKGIFERSVGYAVFDATKVALLVTGGGGTGVVVDRGTGRRTYMHMGTGGVNLGIGAHVLRLVFLFADHETMDNFTNGGWDAGLAASAVAGRHAANAEASFVNGVAVYQVTDAGLLVGFEVTGSKFWRSRKLNIPETLETGS